MNQEQVETPTETRVYKLERVTRIEPSERWVRVQFGGENIADSQETLLVWDRHFIPVYFFPRQDVREEFLTPAGHNSGERSRYHVNVGTSEARNAAWSYTDPKEPHEPLKDYVAFKWNMMDAWFEEEEQVYVHARDPYSRVDTISSSRHIEVKLDGVTIADTKRPTILFETDLPPRYYLPQEDVNMELLVPSATTTQCPYKGTASYWSIQLGDQVFEDLIWTYPDPIPEAPGIRNLLAVYNEKLDIYVDGRLEPRPEFLKT